MSTGALSPRTSLARQRTIEQRQMLDLLMNLTPSSVAYLHEQFEENDGECNIEEFVLLLMKVLPRRLELRNSEFDPKTGTVEGTASGLQIKHLSDQEIASSLYNLFEEIDIDSGGSVSWEEFSTFLVDKAVETGDDYSVTSIAEYTPVHALGPEKKDKLSKLKEQKGQAEDRKKKKFSMLERVQYVAPLDAIAVMQARHPVISLHDAHTLAPKKELRPGKDNDVVLCVESLRSPINSRQSYLMASCADGSLTMWDIAPGPRQYTFLARWRTPYAQTAMVYSKAFHQLYTGSTLGLIHTWDLQSQKETSCMNGHTDIVSALVEMEQLEHLASASMDRSVCVWDMCAGTLRQRLLGHTKAVSCLTYDDHYRLLASGSYDHTCVIWSPFVARMVYTLTGHDTPIVGVHSVPDSPEIITASMDGKVKIWDLRMFKCVQTLSVDNDSPGAAAVNYLDYCPKHNQIILAAQSLTVFKQVQDPKLQVQTDSIPIVSAQFDPLSMTIVTASGKTLKVWCVLTGTLKKVYRNIVPSDISAISLDNKGRKVVVGQSDGSTSVFNYKTGSIVQKLVAHKDEVTGILYLPELTQIVTYSRDRKVRIHLDESGEQTSGEGIDAVQLAESVVTEFGSSRNAGHKRDITSADYFTLSSSELMFVTGSADGTACVWDVANTKLEAVLKHKAEVTLVLVLRDEELVITADADGNILIWNTKDHPSLRFQLMGAFKHNPELYLPPRAERDERRRAINERLMQEAELKAKQRQEFARRLRKKEVLGDVYNSAIDGELPTEEDWSAIDKDMSAANELSDSIEDFVLSYPLLEPTNVVAAAWHPALQVLYVGDDRGQLVAWDLSRAIAAISRRQAEAMPQIDLIFDLSRVGERRRNSIRASHPSIAAAAASNAKAASLSTSVAMCCMDVTSLIAVQWCVNAHHDSITSVRVMEGPFPLTVLTSGYDGNVCAWRRTGHHMGTLCRGMKAQRNWKWHVPVDVHRVHESKEDLVAEILEKAKEDADSDSANDPQVNEIVSSDWRKDHPDRVAAAMKEKFAAPHAPSAQSSAQAQSGDSGSAADFAVARATVESPLRKSGLKDRRNDVSDLSDGFAQLRVRNALHVLSDRLGSKKPGSAKNVSVEDPLSALSSQHASNLGSSLNISAQDASFVHEHLTESTLNSVPKLLANAWKSGTGVRR